MVRSGRARGNRARTWTGIATVSGATVTADCGRQWLTPAPQPVAGQLLGLTSWPSVYQRADGDWHSSALLRRRAVRGGRCGRVSRPRWRSARHRQESGWPPRSAGAAGYLYVSWPGRVRRCTVKSTRGVRLMTGYGVRAEARRRRAVSVARGMTGPSGGLPEGGGKRISLGLRLLETAAPPGTFGEGLAISWGPAISTRVLRRLAITPRPVTVSGEKVADASPGRGLGTLVTVSSRLAFARCRGGMPPLR